MARPKKHTEDMDQVAFRLPVELKQRLVQFAGDKMVFVNDVLTDAVKIHLASMGDKRLALAILDTPIFTGDLQAGFDEEQFLKTAGMTLPWTPTPELLASLAEFAESAAVERRWRNMRTSDITSRPGESKEISVLRDGLAAVESESTWGDVDPVFSAALTADVLDQRENELSMMRQVSRMHEPIQITPEGQEPVGYSLGEVGSVARRGDPVTMDVRYLINPPTSFTLKEDMDDVDGVLVADIEPVDVSHMEETHSPEIPETRAYLTAPFSRDEMIPCQAVSSWSELFATWKAAGEYGSQMMADATEHIPNKAWPKSFKNWSEREQACWLDDNFPLVAK